jgi:hypothetical protein
MGSIVTPPSDQAGQDGAGVDADERGADAGRDVDGGRTERSVLHEGEGLLLNVENFVYEPRNPIASKGRNKSGVRRSVLMVSTIPTRSDPVTLMMNVPNGKVAPSRSTTKPPTRKRAFAPSTALIEMAM